MKRTSGKLEEGVPVSDLVSDVLCIVPATYAALQTSSA